MGRRRTGPKEFNICLPIWESCSMFVPQRYGRKFCRAGASLGELAYTRRWLARKGAAPKRWRLFELQKNEVKPLKSLSRSQNRTLTLAVDR
jgi:hypothetical protein